MCSYLTILFCHNDQFIKNYVPLEKKKPLWTMHKSCTDICCGAGTDITTFLASFCYHLTTIQNKPLPKLFLRKNAWNLLTEDRFLAEIMSQYRIKPPWVQQFEQSWVQESNRYFIVPCIRSIKFSHKSWYMRIYTVKKIEGTWFFFSMTFVYLLQVY